MNNSKSVHSIVLGTLCVGTLAFLTSCGGGGTSTDAVESSARPEAEVRREIMAEIDSLENIVYVDTFDYKAAEVKSLLDTYRKYINEFPGDKAKTPEFLYKSAALSRAENNPLAAIKYYDQILKDYPEYERTPEAAFLLAFTYDADLNKPERAKEAYQSVVENFPDDLWGKQAAARLKTIGLTDEELIQSFMEKNNLE